MAVLFSKEFNISKERMNEVGVFDVFLDMDSPFFINIKRLQNCKIPEFTHSYEKINARFHDIGILLKMSKPGSKLYKGAFKKFNFTEVNGINLGFASGKYGAGFGKHLRTEILKDAYEIIQSGSTQPEIFHLVSLFEDNVGPDRLSDMIAGIILSDIISYTQRIYSELKITAENYPNYKFESGIAINPYKNMPLLLLPESILHELPIAKCWDDIERVCAENEAIRAEINEMVSEEWNKLSAHDKKAYLREQVFKDPDKLSHIIDAYKQDEIEACNLYRTPEYTTNYLKATYKMPETVATTSYDAAMDILENFKQWVEFHRGSSVINGVSQKPSEKLVQKMIHAVAQMFCDKFNWDFSPEVDSGRGPVDFKISRGIDKTVIELKLTSNRECVHGLEVQIEEYAKAEGTNNKIFVIVDTGSNSYRVKEVQCKSKEMLAAGLSPATVIVIDAVPKKSASKYVQS